MVETSASPAHRSGPGFKRGRQTSFSRPLRVLLAEDNKINQQFATLVLTNAGHSVEIAGNGREAVDALGRSDFDVVLMDIQMPVLDGVQATQEIRALPEPKSSIPIIAVTAHTMAGAREEYLAAGMNDYIAKPYKPGLLLAALTKLTSRGATPIPVATSQVPEAGAQIDDLPVLDLEQLSTLGLVFSAPKIRTLALLYMIDVEGRLVLMAECRAKNDFDGVSRQAHMIVSTAGNLGAKQSSAIAHSLEVSCVERNDARADQLITELRTSCALSSRAIKDWLGVEPTTTRRGAG